MPVDFIHYRTKISSFDAASITEQQELVARFTYYGRGGAGYTLHSLHVPVQLFFDFFVLKNAGDDFL